MREIRFVHSLLTIPALALPLALMGACSDDGGSGPPDAWPVDGAPVIDAPAIDAEPAGQAVTIKFAIKVGDADVGCGATAYDDLGTAGSSVTFNDARFYVSNIRLRSGTTEVPMNLEQDDTWQYRDVALLDFEDGTGGCAAGGNADTNDRVVGTVPAGSYDGIVFDLGVPYALNHQDLTTAPSPLNVASMYWAWATGRKFLRLDMSVAGGEGWDVHLGSVLCDSPNPPTAPPDTGCDRENRARVALTGFDPATSTVVLDLTALLADSDLSANAGGGPGCESFPDDTGECTPLFPKLGLDFATGDCVDDCGAQSAFRVE
jgi:uncharacterized repeat protein (TIGR04052 family)